MDREDRLNLIKRLITENTVSKQEQLVKLMVQEGVHVTQATLSRDMRDLSIVKIYRDGKSLYAILDQRLNTSDFESIYRQFVLRASSAMFMVVCHTRLGEADLLANEFDRVNRPEILGTVAGADTLLVICANVHVADKLVEEIKSAIQ